MAVNRFIPPVTGDSRRAFEDVAKALDDRAILGSYAPSYAAQLTAAAGEFKRLAPRAAGQEVIIPTADGANFGDEITLFVEAGLGTLRVRPTSGTINGGTSVSFGPGTYVVQLRSNGSGRWAGGASRILAGNALEFTDDTLEYVGSTSNITLTGSTGNLGTVDISTLEAGGSLFIAAPVAPWQIEGFSSKPAGFWFNLYTSNAAQYGTLLHEDGTPAATNRLRCPGSADARVANGMQAVICKGVSPGGRWSCVVPAVRAAALTQTTAQTVTNAVTNLTAGSLTIPATALVVGSEYEARATIHTARGATATAANVIVELLVGGLVIRTVTIPTTTTSGHLGWARIEGRATARTVGATGTLMITLQVLESISNADATPDGNAALIRQDPIPAAAAAGTTALDTTVDLGFELRARFSAAVANLSMHMYHDTLRQVV